MWWNILCDFHKFYVETEIEYYKQLTLILL